jgi:hypothetical protein
MSDVSNPFSENTTYDTIRSVYGAAVALLEGHRDLAIDTLGLVNGAGSEDLVDGILVAVGENVARLGGTEALRSMGGTAEVRAAVALYVDGMLPNARTLLTHHLDDRPRRDVLLDAAVLLAATWTRRLGAAAPAAQFGRALCLGLVTEMA